MTEPAPEHEVTAMELLAKQAQIMQQLLASFELLQAQVESLRRRVQALEGVPAPGQEPPRSD